MLYEMRDDLDLICYWYTMNSYTGKWVFQSKCIGYDIPYGVSLTSPEQEHYDITLPLAKPNGVYTNGVTSSATWILEVNDEGEIIPVYTEQEICVKQKNSKIRPNLVEDWSIEGMDY